MDSWGRSACYPRRTFYPLSDGPSTRDRRITKSYFRTCSTCMSRSQAPLYFCALRVITNHAEGTFELLRYSLGGDRPSQTAQLTLSLTQIHGIKLESLRIKGGISPLAPPKLTPRLQSLPPILHSIRNNPMIAYSKGARGLSV